MRIAYVTSHYNWESYSMARCGFEALYNRGMDVSLFFEKNLEIFDYDQIWLMSSGLKLTAEEFKQTKGLVLSFGLSDPLSYDKDKARTADIVFTNDYGISQKTGWHWFPTSCDIRYHRYIGLSKEYDVLFYGCNSHPIIGNRSKVIDMLRSAGLKVIVFGEGWPEHPDTHTPILGSKLVQKINKARLVVDISNRDSSLPRRIFEASGCGTTVLTCNRQDIRMLFRDNELLFYDTHEELLAKTKEYLAHYEEQSQIGLRARDRCILAHNITQRIERVLWTIGMKGKK